MAISTQDTRPQTHIGILAIPGFAVMSYAATVEPFRAANLLSGQQLYHLTHLTPQGGEIHSSGSAFISADTLIHPSAEFDYLFVIAGGDPIAYQDRRVFSWLRLMARRTRSLGGVSGGPAILARAGVMTGRRMTVHWEHAEALSEVAPELLLERSLYVIDRDRMTCAGGIAALDMMHSLIAEHHGAKFARQVSDWFLHTDVRPAVGPQRGEIGERLGVSNPNLIEAVRAMEAMIAEPATLPRLAEIVGLSPRQLNRLFQTYLGTSTMAFYDRLRLEKAKTLLHHSGLSITDIALATGFANPSHFSNRFLRQNGMTPTTYRVRRT